MKVKRNVRRYLRKNWLQNSIDSYLKIDIIEYRLFKEFLKAGIFDNQEDAYTLYFGAKREILKNLKNLLKPRFDLCKESICFNVYPNSETIKYTFEYKGVSNDFEISYKELIQKSKEVGKAITSYLKKKTDEQQKPKKDSIKIRLMKFALKVLTKRENKKK